MSLVLLRWIRIAAEDDIKRGGKLLNAADTLLPKSLQFFFFDSELRESALQAHEQLRKYKYMRFVQTIDAGKMNRDFSGEQPLSARMA